MHLPSRQGPKHSSHVIVIVVQFSNICTLTAQAPMSPMEISHARPPARLAFLSKHKPPLFRRSCGVRFEPGARTLLRLSPWSPLLQPLLWIHGSRSHALAAGAQRRTPASLSPPQPASVVAAAAHRALGGRRHAARPLPHDAVAAPRTALALHPHRCCCPTPWRCRCHRGARSTEQRCHRLRWQQPPLQLLQPLTTWLKTAARTTERRCAARCRRHC
jgi:hypothetical protein